MLSNLFFGKHLEKEETVVRVVHKHWFLGMRAVFFPTLIFAALAALLALRPVRVVFLSVSLVEVVVSVWWLRNFLDHYLDAWIITDHGIVDVEWHGWFHRQSARVLYSDVQGVSYEINGLLGTLLQVGTISIEKISTGSEIVLEQVKRPRVIERIILRCQENYLHSKNLKNGKHLQELIASLVSERMQLDELQPVGEDESE